MTMKNRVDFGQVSGAMAHVPVVRQVPKPQPDQTALLEEILRAAGLEEIR